MYSQFVAEVSALSLVWSSSLSTPTACLHAIKHARGTFFLPASLVCLLAEVPTLPQALPYVHPYLHASRVGSHIYQSSEIGEQSGSPLSLFQSAKTRHGRAFPAGFHIEVAYVPYLVVVPASHVVASMKTCC